MTITATHPRWAAAADEHRVALAAYLAAGAALSDAEWQRPWGPGKWTPAQVTEHLALAYDALLAEIRDGQPMRLKLTPLRRGVARWLILPHILFHRSFPLRAASPRELRPAAPRAPRQEALRALDEGGERFEASLAEAFAAGGGRLTHPYFGQVDAIRSLRFVAVHLEHHRRQIDRVPRG